MAREKRIWYEGAVYHVMARGIRKSDIYKSTDDYESFLMIVKSVKAEIHFDIYGICLMTNHFHMLIKTYDVEIGQIMAKIMHDYAMTFNRKYGYHGHLFDSRYASKLVENSRYLLEVSRYIHLNPVKARMVSHPEDYIYSSYNLYSGLSCNRPEGEHFLAIMEKLTEISIIQDYFYYDKEWEYSEYVEEKAGHHEIEASIREAMKENEEGLPA